ncbi:hypothetical protein PG991_015215 [Apiospora marii]|uniref:Uncharacterized protein n=1 Tax=Apiospora marii TaxID=335849 RepID=A0ABR1R1V7_9PEZI
MLAVTTTISFVAPDTSKYCRFPIGREILRIVPPSGADVTDSNNKGDYWQVVDEGVEVWSSNSGFRDVDSRPPPQSDTVFNLNSMAERTTAVAFACLVRDGAIGWDMLKIMMSWIRASCPSSSAKSLLVAAGVVGTFPARWGRLG